MLGLQFTQRSSNKFRGIRWAVISQRFVTFGHYSVTTLILLVSESLYILRG